MQAKILALYAAAQAAAVLVPSDQDVTTISDSGIIYKRDVTNVLNERTVCNADNCLRNLRDQRYSSSASNFCSTFIQSTVINTFYAVTTDKKTVMATPPVIIVTDVQVVNAAAITGTDTVTASACSCFIATPAPAIQQSLTLTTPIETQISTDILPTPTTIITQTSTITSNVAATETAYAGVRYGHRGCSVGTNGPNIESTTNYPTLQLCKARCMQVPECTAFQFTTYNPASPYCNLARVDANSWWYLYSAGNAICDSARLYDRNCAI
ncbi:hypothetical protein PT974_07883 [Cladobotryum mycophilum]|uniref:Apple domain-containing protein n=1 Tax=Cladobotryum mycophilum TaxID=491253 RepID=A0ABR0SCC7_9HYPO